MRKYLLCLAVMLMGSTLLTGCLSDSDSNNKEVEYVVTQGALILNSGNYYSGIDGSLTHLDYTTNPVSAQQNVFKNANGISLGGTPNDILVFGNKVFIAGTDENVVFVLNKNNFELIDTIRTTRYMGENGISPRHLAGYGSKVYVSTYGSSTHGYVGVIDTLALSIEDTYEVGSKPEGLGIGTVSNGSTTEATLYVANSDYGYGNGSISKISLLNGTVTTATYENIKNPQEIAVAGDVLYVLDWGSYDENSNQVGAGVYMINGTTVMKVVPDATGMSGAGQSIVTYNNPYGSYSISYSIYNITTGALNTFNLSGDSASPIISPSAISIDPNTGWVLIASRPLDPDTGYPSYTLPGFVNIYNGSGVFSTSLSTGVEPHSIAFAYKIATLNQ